MTRRKLLEKAIAIVCEDRNQQYGHPENSAEIALDDEGEEVQC